MSTPYSIRSLAALALILAFLLGLAALLLITDLSFSVWQHLQRQPGWLFWTLVLGFAAVALLFGRLLWRLLLPKRSHGGAVRKQPESISREQLEQRIESAQQQGMETEQARRELEHLAEREALGDIHIAVFGEISSGKSSLLQALLPGARLETGVVGGTTREIRCYRWENELDLPLVLVDMPGLNEQAGTLNGVSRDEMARSHIALFLVDGDLTADQYASLRTVVDFGKPCILVLNKTDLFNQQELERLLGRLRERVNKFNDSRSGARVEVVAARAGGTREVTRLLPDGSEQQITRPRDPDLGELQNTLRRLLKQYSSSELEGLRRNAVLSLVWQQLDQQQVKFRRQRSADLVKSSTGKAVIAALATVSPGTDLVVQGYLGFSMVQALCRLYQVPVSDLEIQKLLKMTARDRDKTLPLLLAIAGNGLKAFPGVGTVAGGFMHAVAYGMIFDALGKAVARTLELQGELSPVFADRLYKEKLGENVEKRARAVIRMALEAGREKAADASRD